MAPGLVRQLLRPILGVGDQAVAAHTDQLHRISEVVVQSSDLGLHMFHKGAMGTKHHQQHWPLVQRTSAQPTTRDLGKIKIRQACAQRQHRGWCQGHKAQADAANLLQDGHLRW